MFGLGLAELLIFMVVLLLVLGLPIAVVVLLVFLLRKGNTSEADTRIAQLMHENQQLRDELAARHASSTR